MNGWYTYIAGVLSTETRFFRIEKNSQLYTVLVKVKLAHTSHLGLSSVPVSALE